MLRTPRDPSRHLGRCMCRGCSDPDVQFFKTLNRPRHHQDQWEAVDLSRPPRESLEVQPERPAGDFEADMAALVKRIGGDR